MQIRSLLCKFFVEHFDKISVFLLAKRVRFDCLLCVSRCKSVAALDTILGGFSRQYGIKLIFYRYITLRKVVYVGSFLNYIRKLRLVMFSYFSL